MDCKSLEHIMGTPLMFVKFSELKHNVILPVCFEAAKRRKCSRTWGPHGVFLQLLRLIPHYFYPEKKNELNSSYLTLRPLDRRKGKGNISDLDVSTFPHRKQIMLGQIQVKTIDSTKWVLFSFL